MEFGSRRTYTTMPSKLRSSRLLLISLLLLLFYSTTLLRRPTTPNLVSPPPCDLFSGRWVYTPETPKPLYDETCPFHRNAWNCLKNRRENMGVINSWRWVPDGCGLSRIDPTRFLERMRNKNIGFVGDSLNENFVVSLLCILRVADPSAVKWKKKKAWRGAYFPKFNVTVAYHRSVLLAKYNYKLVRCRSREANEDGVKGAYRVDVDVPADEWINVTSFYDVLVFNSGHWWGYDKFPKETPLVFYRKGKPIHPPLDILQGFEVVVQQMVSYIQRQVPAKSLKFWRLQSPRHFYGGDWNQNGSCLLDKPLDKDQLDLWFDPRNNGVNKEARRINQIIKSELQNTEIKLLDLTHLSEYRADAHPAIWLGKQDAVAIWGQDCMHWCLPGVPDTWVDILAELILEKEQNTSLKQATVGTSLRDRCRKKTGRRRDGVSAFSGLSGVLPLSILLAEEPFGLLSLDSPGPSVVSSPARLPRWLSSALSLFLAVYLSRFLSYGSPFGLLSLSIPLVGGSGHLRDASLGGSHWRPICRRRSI
uniref:Uncharacterized protein n=1 Tax=Brassica oleracea TaxID=3712 RepID=A0A3P6BGT4_BRAOL|nr:unnamed protein product [Brassica oleracea]